MDDNINSTRNEVPFSQIEYSRKQYFSEKSWCEDNHRLHPSSFRKTIFTILMIASKQNGIPRHPGVLFYKLPKEILYTVFRFIDVYTGNIYLKK